jgi:ppGpp synthetase/RelA/SpoT-type nucleotidyltranferase
VSLALSGADSVRDRMVSFLTMGICDIAQHCYAIKCRVKSEKSLVEKVSFKRRTKNSGYAASDATDIIGLRLLVLHHGDLLATCRRLVDFLRFGLQNYTGLFSGSNLDNCIREVVVYDTGQNEHIYKSIYEYFMSLALYELPDGSPKVRSAHSTREQPYSSVHLVCNAIAPEARLQRRIPVEIQIRTVLEDAWAEVDHDRRYKGLSYDGAKHGEPIKALQSAVEGQLANLKSTLDSSSQTIDEIVKNFSRLEDIALGSKKFVPSYIASGANRFTVSRKMDRHAPKAVREKIQLLDAKLLEISGRIGADTNQAKRRSNLSRLEHICHQLEALQEEYRAHPKYERDFDFYFWVRMEIAYCTLWQARLTKSLRLREDYAQQTLAVYNELEESGKFSDSVWLKYRTAMAFLTLNMLDRSTSKFQEAVRLLSKDKRIPKSDAIRCIVPRQYGYALWLNRIEKWNTSTKSVDSLPYLGTSHAEFVKDAVHYTLQALHELKKMSLSESERKVEFSRTMNNLVCYAWELRDLGESVDLLKTDSFKQDLESFYAIVAEEDLYSNQLLYADTHLKLADLLRKPETVKKLTRLVQKLIAKGPDLTIDIKTLDYTQYCLNRIRQRQRLMGGSYETAS